MRPSTSRPPISWTLLTASERELRRRPLPILLGLARMRPTVAMVLVWAVPLIAQERPAQILQIYRDPLTQGREAAYKAVEQEAARICAHLSFPHPHLAIESLTGPKEVWWLNAFASEAERQGVTRDYASNPALVAALGGIVKRKEGLTGTPVDVLTTYKADLSGGVLWEPAGARLFVVTVTKRDLQAKGSVFEAPDGSRYVLRPVRTRREADAEAAALGPETRVFAVRPYWGMPAKEWIAADPEFWRTNPMARQK